MTNHACFYGMDQCGKAKYSHYWKTMQPRKNDVIINFYFTPTVLTTNSLIFDQDKMKQWWKIGFEYAKRKNINLNELID